VGHDAEFARTLLLSLLFLFRIVHFP
jgi:hypothetical protein